MRLSVLPLSVLVLSLSACKAHTATAASETPPAAPAADGSTTEPETEPLVGGFHARDAGEPDVAQAAEEAVKLMQAAGGDTSIALVKVRKAAAQVVAGMNYRLDLELTTATGATAKRVVVYRALDGQYSLTSADSIE